MSEADNPQELNKSQSLPEPTAPMEASIDDRTDATSLENKSAQQLDSEDTAQLAHIQETLEVADISADVMNRDMTPSTSATTAPTDNTAITIAQETNWLVLVQKLRQRNQGLLNQIIHLEQALSECQETLQSQKAKSQAQDAIIAKASQEITTSQEQTTRLFRELESSHQVAQRQQILIETLTEQLESSQERMAQMERECALTQQRYNEQSHLLLQTENTVRELRDRLHRQQRHTLQFKAALEKCLEVPAINYETNTEAVNSLLSFWQEEHLNSILASPGVLPKAQPIQPWSAKPELLADSSSFLQHQENLQLLKDEESVPHDELRVKTFQPLGEHRRPEEKSLVIGSWSANDDEEPMTTSGFHFQPHVEEMPHDQTDEAVGEADQDSSMTVFLSTEQELSEQQQDALLELTRLSQILDQPKANFSLESAASVDAWGSQTDQYEGNYDSLSSQNVSLPEATEAEAVVQEGDFAYSSATDTNSQEHFQAIPQPNWPSPVVYPQRPSKGLKSLAAVELPTFPRRNE